MKRKNSSPPPRDNSNNTSFKKGKRTRGRGRSGLTPSPERRTVTNSEPLMTVEDIEREKQLTNQVSSEFYEFALQLFETPENVLKLKEAMFKAHLDAMRSNDFRREILQTIQKEQDKLKQSVLIQTKESKDAFIEAEMDYREKKNKVLKQEIAIKQNEKKIIDLQKEFNRLRGIVPVEADEKLKEAERKKLEEEELAKKKIDQEKLLEAKKKEEEESEKERLLMARKTGRSNVSFSLFGGL